MKKKFSPLVKILVILLAAALTLPAAYVVYCLVHTDRALHTLEEYRAAYPDLRIMQDAAGSISVLPAAEADHGTGIVFYAGASIEPLAYTPLLAGLAEAGYSVYAPQFPCGMAFFRADAAADILASHPEHDTWVIAGHSLGGRCATGYAASDSDRFLGVICIASRVESRFTQTQLPLLMLYGNLDNIYHGPTEADTLPENTTVNCIPGANHAQFADCHSLPLDHDAELSGEEQRSLAVSAMLDWLAAQAEHGASSR